MFAVGRLDLRLEHKVLKSLRGLPLARGRWLLAMSGGLDSIVLAEILWRWRRFLGMEPVVAHVHHGSPSSYRDKAQACVRAWARSRRVRLITNRAGPSGLRSEADLRDFRYRCLNRWRREMACQRIVLAHHRDDLLETRLLRLIRGCGAAGLTSMQMQRGYLLRPLLDISRAELAAYAQTRQLSWCEDPSNHTVDPFRNWLRHEWLPRLEAKQKGATRALARSLDLLSPEESPVRLGPYVGLRRKDVQEASMRSQQSVIANYFRVLGLQGYGRAHVEEVQKRLSARRGHFEFEMLGCRFRVTPDLVWASRV